MISTDLCSRWDFQEYGGGGGCSLKKEQQQEYIIFSRIPQNCQLRSLGDVESTLPSHPAAFVCHPVRCIRVTHGNKHTHTRGRGRSVITGKRGVSHKRGSSPIIHSGSRARPPLSCTLGLFKSGPICERLRFLFNPPGARLMGAASDRLFDEQH